MAQALTDLLQEHLDRLAPSLGGFGERIVRLNDGQEVVEVVRNAAGEQSEPFELLARVKLALTGAAR